MLLEVKNISKYIGTFLMKDVSFELPEGYIMGLIGENGAGKTTLLHLLLGLYQPDAGEILIDGMNYRDNEREIRELLGTVLLDDLFDTSLTLEQNGNFYGRYYVNYNAQTLLYYLEKFSLDKSCKFKRLSKGEKLKFQFAFALSHNAKLLLLDEPTGNFDREFRKEFFAELKEFIADGTRSVILSTHLTEDLDRVADYITYLEKGRILLTSDIETLRDSYRLVTGETYKIKLLPEEDLVYMEEGAYGTRALVRHHKYRHYDAAVTALPPSIEELMYFMTKRG